MRKLILKMASTFDGFVAGPNGELDWMFKTSDPAAQDWELETLWVAGLHAMGARTFHDMAAWWPTSTEVYAPAMNQIPKVVFTRRGIDQASTTQGLEDARALQPNAQSKDAQPGAESWKQPYVARGDLREEVERLKRQDGKPILAHGGASFARALVAAALVDELRLLVHPIAIGKGMPLFSDLREPRRFAPVGITVFPSGCCAQILRPV
jgi:dihydrofolate reductase